MHRLAFAGALALGSCMLTIAAVRAWRYHRSSARWLVGALALSVVAIPLAGCNSVSSDVTAANNALATLASNDIPTACAIVTVAEGYFAQLKSQLSAAEIADEAKAALVVNSICASPPTNISAAFGSLLTAWTVIQADTTVPAAK